MPVVDAVMPALVKLCWPDSGTDLEVGWTVGAGWEYALGYGWSIKSEFLYVDFGWQRFFDPPDTCSSCDEFAIRDVKLNNYIFRLGMNYKFDWGKYPVGKYPVVAKY